MVRAREFEGRTTDWAVSSSVSPRSGRVSGQGIGLRSSQVTQESPSERMHKGGPVEVRVDPRQPNLRLKLTAPVIYCRIAFVNVLARRRSLGAPR